MRPPYETFRKPICRGSYEFGDACDQCEKCRWEKWQGLNLKPRRARPVTDNRPTVEDSKVVLTVTRELNGRWTWTVVHSYDAGADIETSSSDFERAADAAAAGCAVIEAAERARVILSGKR